MRYLLDTNALIWTLGDNGRIDSVKDEITNPENEIFFSTANIWEIALKEAKGKITLKDSDAFIAAIKQGFTELPILSKHIAYIKTLSLPDSKPAHKDPFDQLLIAQAKCEGLILITGDNVIGRYMEPCIKMI